MKTEPFNFFQDRRTKKPLFVMDVIFPPPMIFKYKPGRQMLTFGLERGKDGIARYVLKETEKEKPLEFTK